MGRSLVLNASYEPLGTVAARRAVVLVLADKADLVHATGLVLHSETISIEVPSVVRLRQFVHVPFRRRVAVSRRTVMARDGHRCQYCGAHADSIDHVQPRSKGGTHTWENVVAACRPCNVRKRDRLLQDSGMRLKRPPSVPNGVVWSILAGGSVPPEWAEYLGESAPAELALAAAPAAAS
jgi:5-methylcytosine-specific restriction endonuclease McrA